MTILYSAHSFSLFSGRRFGFLNDLNCLPLLTLSSIAPNGHLKLKFLWDPRGNCVPIAVGGVSQSASRCDWMFHSLGSEIEWLHRFPLKDVFNLWQNLKNSPEKQGIKYSSLWQLLMCFLPLAPGISLVSFSASLWRFSPWFFPYKHTHLCLEGLHLPLLVLHRNSNSATGRPAW